MERESQKQFLQVECMCPSIFVSQTIFSSNGGFSVKRNAKMLKSVTIIQKSQKHTHTHKKVQTLTPAKKYCDKAKGLRIFASSPQMCFKCLPLKKIIHLPIIQNLLDQCVHITSLDKTFETLTSLFNLLPFQK